jgi:RNA polymerase sigma factor (sigma-70 family)
VVIDEVAYVLYREPSDLDAEIENALAELSPREAQVARLAARGMSAKAIAQALAIKPYTVDTYIRRLYHKLQIHSRAALAYYLARRAL